PDGVIAWVGWTNRFLIVAYCVWVITVAWQAIKLGNQVRQTIIIDRFEQHTKIMSEIHRDKKLSINKETKMQKITTFLTYNNQAEEAANFYTSLFENSKINDVMHAGDAVMGVSFQLAGQQFNALN